MFLHPIAFALALALPTALAIPTSEPGSRSHLPMVIDSDQRYRFFPNGDAPDGINFVIIDRDGSEIVPDIFMNHGIGWLESRDDSDSSATQKPPVKDFFACNGRPDPYVQGNCDGDCKHYAAHPGGCYHTPGTNCLYIFGDGYAPFYAQSGSCKRPDHRTSFSKLEHYGRPTSAKKALGAPGTNSVKWTK